MSAICQYCGIAMGQVKRFEMEMARRFPEQENVGGCRYFGGWPVAKAGTQGRAANATKREARETKAHGGLRVFPCPIGTKEGALTWVPGGQQLHDRRKSDAAISQSSVCTSAHILE